MLTLYQFECSHYCEKARWALDHKGLSYEVRNLIPGPHRHTTESLAPTSEAPILVHDGQAIQGSAAIIDYLDRGWPERRLTPQNPQSGSLACEWERYFDAEIGVTIRCWFYYHALPHRALATRFLLKGTPWYGRPLYALIFPVVRRAMRQAMHIDAENAARSEARLRAALKRLDEAQRGHRYLVDGRFSRADLAACALLSPLVFPDPTLDLPAPISRFRAEHEGAPFFAWVAETYRRQRPASSG